MDEEMIHRAIDALDAVSINGVYVSGLYKLKCDDVMTAQECQMPGYN